MPLYALFYNWKHVGFAVPWATGSVTLLADPDDWATNLSFPNVFGGWVDGAGYVFEPTSGMADPRPAAITVSLAVGATKAVGLIAIANPAFGGTDPLGGPPPLVSADVLASSEATYAAGTYDVVLSPTYGAHDLYAVIVVDLTNNGTTPFTTFYAGGSVGTNSWPDPTDIAVTGIAFGTVAFWTDFVKSVETA